ncbi:MAG TPA: asparagine synthase (glutamine-hydrolyzing), partial [Fibrobacteria bacterium]|nr:asparagine synthase (glutamine-hydrolyzing) [Fibrobacteria bacterium]
HRGPDEEGYYETDCVAFGHKRLSIIDLSGGQQPMHNEDRSVWTVFNGEIFNYIELRDELKKKGHVFCSHSDTEVIVHLYEEYGADFVEHLNGQFAIAVWDIPRQRLVLTRDRVGIRPLFYSRRPDGAFLFASEMKALFGYPGVERELDPAGLAQTSMLWVSIPPRTLFKGIEELGAGRTLILEDGRARTVQYWKHRFPDADGFEDRPLSHFTGKLREILHDSTTLQLRSDVPVAAYLSGGIDSSITCALVKKYHNNDLITFSVAFKDERFDERSYQMEMVKHLGTDHRMIEVGYEDIGRDFAAVIWNAERPMMRTAPAPLLALSRLVRQNGIKVVLTGEGADEVFGGYNIFKEDKVRRFWARQPDSAFRPLALTRLYGYIERDPQAESFWKLFFRKGLEDVDNPYYSHLIRWNNSVQMRRFFHPDLKAQFPSDEAVFADLKAYLDPDMMRWHPLNRAQYLEMALFMSCYLLNSQGDRMMMGNSIEGRFPFLDHRLIEFGATVPPKYKIHGLTEKYVLKKSFEDLVPPSIVNRPKKPYRAPIAACFKGDTLAARLLRPEALAKAGIANAPAFGKLMQKAGEDGRGLSEREEMAVATVTSMQLLHHLFIDTFKETVPRE